MRVLLSNHRLIQFFLVALDCLRILWFCLAKYRIYLVYFYLSNLLIYELDDISF